MIYVVNKHHRPYEVPDEAPVFNVMRPTIFGNPYIIGRDGVRTQVVHKYRRWLWSNISQSTLAQRAHLQALDQLVAIARTGDLVLECCCAPRLCHADIIKAAIEWRLKNG